MWTFFEDGTFYSAVTDRVDSDLMVIRSRDRQSAERFADWLGGDHTISDEPGDYAYRVRCSRTDWSDFVADKVDNARATNFKSEVQRNLGVKRGKLMLDALHDIWSVMWDYQRKVQHGGSMPY